MTVFSGIDTHTPPKTVPLSTKGLNQVFPRVKHMLDHCYMIAIVPHPFPPRSYKALISEFFPASETRRHKDRSKVAWC